MTVVRFGGMGRMDFAILQSIGTTSHWVYGLVFA
jgi:hypothetical protein